MSRFRILTIIIAVLLVVLIILVFYNLFLKDNRPGPAPIGSFFSLPEDLVIDTLEGITQFSGPLARLSMEHLVGIEMTESYIVSISDNGQVAVFNFNGEPSARINIPLPSGRLLKTSFDPTIGVFTFFMVEANNDRWFLFRGDKRLLESLSPAVTGAVFSPEGELTIVEEDENGSGVVLQNGGVSRTIFSGNIPDLETDWVDERTITLSTTPSGTAPGILYLLDTASGRLTRLLGNRYGLTALVSSDKDWVVYAETESSGRNLLVKSLDILSGQEKALGIQTLPEKCVFSKLETAVVYCATFLNSPRTSLMPDDYRKDIFQNRTSDVVRIELGTGFILTLRENLSVDPISLKLSPDEQVLFFINKRDGSLYRLIL